MNLLRDKGIYDPNLSSDWGVTLLFIYLFIYWETKVYMTLTSPRTEGWLFYLFIYLLRVKGIYYIFLNKDLKYLPFYENIEWLN